MTAMTSGADPTPRPHAIRRQAGAISALALRLIVWGPAGGAAQTTAPELDAPGPEHRRLDALAGLWDVTVRIPTSRDDAVEGRASCEAGWVMDGRFLRQEYSSVFDGYPLRVVRYLGFDRHAGRFVEVQFESTRTDVLRAEGTLSGDGRTLKTVGTHVDPATGREATVRAVTTFLAPDTFTLELTYADSVGQVARSVLLTHRRKFPSAPEQPRAAPARGFEPRDGRRR